MVPSDKPDPAAWGLPDLCFSELPSGHRNRVLLGRNGPKRFVFKTTRRSDDQIAWLDHLRAPLEAAGLSAALPIKARSGEAVVQGWTMEPYLEGCAPEPADLARFDTVLVAFHRNARAVPQRPGFASARDLLNRDAAGDVDLTAMPKELVHLCRIAWQSLPKTPLTAVHSDLHPGNLRVAHTGRFILLDFDEARVDLPLFDRLAVQGLTKTDPAALAFEIATCWTQEPDYAHALARDLSPLLMNGKIRAEKDAP